MAKPIEVYVRRWISSCLVGLLLTQDTCLLNNNLLFLCLLFVLLFIRILIKFRRFLQQKHSTSQHGTFQSRNDVMPFIVCELIIFSNAVHL